MIAFSSSFDDPSVAHERSVLISVTQDHPITGAPAFFVHPCKTASALREVVQRTDGAVEVTAATYLWLWLGLVGSHVSLELPMPISLRPELQQ